MTQQIMEELTSVENPGWLFDIHSRKLTWNLKMMVSNRKLLFQVSIFGCHVSFRGCRLYRVVKGGGC